MARARNVLKHVIVEVAQKKRRCHRDKSHAIQKDTLCLVVVEQRGNKRNYCVLCAQPIVDLAAGHLEGLYRDLRIARPALTTTGMKGNRSNVLGARALAASDIESGIEQQVMELR